MNKDEESNTLQEPVFKKPKVDLFGSIVEDLATLFDFHAEENENQQAPIKKYLYYTAKRSFHE
jgi:hypothetical protein